MMMKPVATTIMPDVKSLMITEVSNLRQTSGRREEDWSSYKLPHDDSEIFATMLDEQSSILSWPGYMSNLKQLCDGDASRPMEESVQNQLGMVSRAIAILAETKCQALMLGTPVEIYLELPRLGGIVMRMSQQGEAVTISLHFSNSNAKKMVEKNRENYQRWLGTQLKKKISLALHSDVQ